MKKLLFLVCMLLPILSYANEIKPDRVVLLQPDIVYREKKIKVEELAAYIRQVQSIIEQELKVAKIKPNSGFFVFAVKANKKSTMWFDLKPALTKQQENNISNAVQKIPPFYVSEGSIIFALQISINGVITDKNPMPYPQAWKKAFKKDDVNPQEIEQLVNKIWP